jgi:hypothetical protein
LSSRLRPLTGVTIAALFAIAAATVACNAILGLGDYVVGPPADAGADAAFPFDSTAPFDAQIGDEPDAAASSASDASDASPASDASVASDAPNCNADPLTFTDPSQCYGCTPTTSPQFANACTTSGCVPFDDTRLTNLLLDGALPPVPPKDASSE